MRRLLFAIGLWAAASVATAAPAPRPIDWKICRGALSSGGAPRLDGCQPLRGPIDPQGREIWLKADIPGPLDMAASRRAVFLFGAASSQAWFNGRPLGANGRPAATAAAEVPGLYEAALPIPPALWRPGSQELVLRASSFHGGMRFDTPLVVGLGRYPQPSRLPQLAVTFTATGALLAALAGFLAVYFLRRTGSALVLAALAGVTALQTFVEAYRSLFNYPYPLHAWRVNAIWGLSGAFALLLTGFAAGRFLPRRRRALLAAAGAAVAATYLLKGFDVKSTFALLVGVGFAAFASLAGLRRGQPGARAMLAYLGAFVVVGLVSPYLLLDVSFFVLAAGLTLSLLVVEVVRLGREDRDRETALTVAASRPDRLTVATGKGVQLVPLGDILAIVGADDYAELRLTGGRTLLHAARLEKLEAQLPSGFMRIHRSALANLAHVDRLERDGSRWRLHLAEGPPLPVSRARIAALRDALDPAPVRLSASVA